ncbi:MAG: SGNH/GDSL hydrolase family protein, partial [Nitrososphaera sp.]|nr:SGNH/GDSL hydrolase family protein [Nitrososphaera sp.]
VVIIWPLLTDYDDYRFESIHEWVREEAEDRGFSIIDLLPSFSKVFYRDLQITAEDSIHPGALGYKLGADAFLAWCRSQKSKVAC